ncbi:winged helix-turn-helix domain-containing protein, partial [Spongiactinospora sp. TRM90649]|nr:winged helix-turn-helix domain-containing protein [Spongiactinospora sp. TRM90649]
MRYPDGGGLPPAARAKREQVRLEAAGLFAAGMSPPAVAEKLRVSRKSAYVRHHAWRTAGAGAPASKGPGGQHCRLNTAQVERLEAALDAGPAVWGWTEDQRWTLARVTVLVGRLFHVSYTPRGIYYLPHRLGWSPRVPRRRRRARRRGDRHLGEGDLAAGGTTARDQDAWICFADEAGQSLRPPKARTWSRRGRTPIVTVPGKGSGRVDLAGLICLKPGRRTRLIYRMMIYRRRSRRSRIGFARRRRSSSGSRPRAACASPSSDGAGPRRRG